MKKEAPITNPSKKPTPIKTNPPKKIEYHQSEKMSLKDFITTIPSEFRPTKIISYSFAIIIILVIVIGLATAPWGAFTDFTSIEKNIAIEIGFPWTFFSLEINNPEKIPVKFGGLILDLLIYIIIAYLINVAINTFKKSFKREKPHHAKLYNIQKPN